MAIIYSYPLVSSIQPSDLLILSVDSSELPTRQVTVGDLLASGAVDVNLNFTADTGTGSVNLSTQSLEVRQGVYVTTTATNQELIINHKSTVRQDTNIGDTSPGYGGSFTVIDSVVTDVTGSGHVTGVNLKTVTLPAADDLGDKNFVFTQALPSTTWIIQHNLGHRYVLPGAISTVIFPIFSSALAKK